MCTFVVSFVFIRDLSRNKWQSGHAIWVPVLSAVPGAAFWLFIALIKQQCLCVFHGFILAIVLWSMKLKDAVLNKKVSCQTVCPPMGKV